MDLPVAGQLETGHTRLSTSTNMAPPNHRTRLVPLRILSLDGGGIRGLSSLLILERIMEDIRVAEGLSEVPKPCDRFDLIGGTSTGGIIAIMLGRLGMTVDECIRAYRKMAKNISQRWVHMEILGSGMTGCSENKTLSEQNKNNTSYRVRES